MTERTASTVLLLMALLVPLPAQAQVIEERLLAVPVGAVLGTAGGGYVALASIVAESRMGRYIHDVDDVLGWRSAPVITGAAVGAALGFYSPRRLEAAAVYGVAGLGIGAVVGLGIGSLVWDPPEGRWAGAAIGAGVGLLAGNSLGILRPYGDPEGRIGGITNVQAAGVPLMIRISF